MKLDQALIIRWLAFLTLLLVMGPGQVFAQVKYYAALIPDPQMQWVLPAMAGGLFVLEAFSITLVAYALKRGAWRSATAFSIVLIPTMIVTFAADLGGISAQLEAAQARRTEAQRLWQTAQVELAEADETIEQLALGIPEPHRAKTAAALTIELAGVRRRIESLAVPPQGLLRTETQLASALASREALDAAIAGRDAKRRAHATPPPDADLPQSTYLARLAGLFGWRASAQDMNTIMAVMLALTVKFATVTGFGVVAPQAGRAQQTSRPSPLQAPPASQQPVQPPAPPVAPAATSAPAQNAPQPSLPLTPTPKPSAPAPTIANVVRSGLNRRRPAAPTTPNAANP